MVGILSATIGATTSDASESHRGASALLEAKRAMRVPKYSEAISLLKGALRDASLGLTQRLDAAQLLGAAYIARGHIDRAEATFADLLALDPNYQLDGTVSPKIQAVFEQVRGKHAPPVQIRALACTRDGNTLRFSAETDDPEVRIAQIDLYVRLADNAFERIPMAGRGLVYTASVASPASPAHVDYYAVGRNGKGRIIAQAGDIEAVSTLVLQEREPVVALAPQPRWIPPPIQLETPESSWLEGWWFWAAIGAAVAGGVSAAILIDQRGARPPVGNLPQIDLR